MAKKKEVVKEVRNLFGEVIKKEEPEVKKKSTAPGLFDYVNMLFQKPREFTKLRPYEKNKNFFMMNRFFSIRFPIQAQMLNNLKINTAEATQYWCDSLSPKFSSTPQWIYNALREVKSVKTSEKAKLDVKDSTIAYYCEKNQCSRKDVEVALSIYGQEFIDELKSLEKMID